MTYEVAGELGMVTACHCRDCRKSQGSSSVVAVVVDASALRWTKGEARITEHESSPGKMRAFCSRCGAPLYSRRQEAPRLLRLRMGSIDTPVDARLEAHIFVTELPPWASLDDEAPRYAGLEPGRREP